MVAEQKFAVILEKSLLLDENEQQSAGFLLNDGQKSNLSTDFCSCSNGRATIVTDGAYVQEKEHLKEQEDSEVSREKMNVAELSHPLYAVWKFVSSLQKRVEKPVLIKKTKPGSLNCCTG